MNGSTSVLSSDPTCIVLHDDSGFIEEVAEEFELDQWFVLSERQFDLFIGLTSP